MPAKGPHLYIRILEVLGQIELTVPGMDVETARFLLRETKVTTSMSDVSVCFHALPDYFALDHDLTAMFVRKKMRSTYLV